MTIEEAAKRVKERELSDCIIHKTYSDNEDIQNAFLDGCAIGMLTSIFMTMQPQPHETSKVDDILQKAINGDKEAIKKLKKEQ